MKYPKCLRAIECIVLSVFLFLSALVAPDSPSDASEITVATPFSYFETVKNAIAQPFEKTTGTRVSLVANRNILRDLIAHQKAGVRIYDVVFLTSGQALQACQRKLLQPLHRELRGPNPCAVEIMSYTMFYVYDSKISHSAPTSIADFFNVNGFPGRRGLQRSPHVSLPWALVADGVLPHHVYTELATASGQKRALTRLGKIKDHVSWWNTREEARMLATTSGVAMTALWSMDIPELVKKKPSLRPVLGGHVKGSIVAGIRVGSATKVGVEFLKFGIEQERQLAIGKQSRYGPAIGASVFTCTKGMCPCSGTNVCSKGCCKRVENGGDFWLKHGKKIRRQFDDAFGK